MRDEARDQLLRDLFGLAGEVAVVTGGMGRLGSEYARTLAYAGAAVAVFDLAEAVNPKIQQVIDGGYCVSIHRVDVADRVAVAAAIDQVVDRFGAPSILVNNAGRDSRPDAPAEDNGPFETYPEAAWDAMLDSHLKGMFLVSQAFIGAFRAAARPRPRTGSIINISSTYGLVSPDQSLYEFRRRDGAAYFKPVAYSVAKSGVLNLTRWLAEYCAPLGIRVNTLAPGGVREAGHPPEFVAEYEKRTPLGRMARDDDYNGAILFLASSRGSGYMTGSLLVVDGGWTAR